MCDHDHSNEDSIKSLCEAAKNGETDCVISFISQGADVNASDDRGFTALFYAYVNANLDCIDVLQRTGADLQMAFLILANNVLENEANGIQKDELQEMLDIAVMKGWWLPALKFIEAGADVNYSDERGRTVLLRASTNGHRECVVNLLQAGANVNAQNNVG